jgi:glycine/D-amino acid oxidase-like deaminating enzyme
MPRLPKLDGDITTDIVIIGGGFTGLNAAWALAQRGVACTVLEANDASWGASGRNGGMAVLRYKKAWSTLAETFGDGPTRDLYALIHEAVDTLERNVSELGIECGFKRYGHITAANGPRAVAMLAADCRWLADRLGDRVPQLLDAEQAYALMGTRAYYGGYLDPRAAGIQPLDYGRGFAAALAERGVPIYCETPAQQIVVEPDHVVVTTPGGEVRARKVLVCSNAYTDLQDVAPSLATRIVAVSTSVVTTAPLPEAILRTVLPQEHLVTDTRHLVNYFRRAPGDRLLFGGRGSLTGKENPEVYDGLIAKLRATYPQLGDTPIDHRWSGKVAVTLDDFPHLGALGDRVLFALGYGGRGVALTNLLGRHLALHALGEWKNLGPMSEASFRPIPFHGLRIPAMNVVATYYKLRDKLRV